MARMGMRRTRHIGLPARLYFKQGRCYYGRAGVALGADKRAALIKYAELETGCTAPGTFADAVKAYREQELPSKATKTREEYSRQLNTLALVFGECAIDSIRPVHVARYLAERGAKVAGAREKALLSAVFNFARRIGLTDAVNPCAGIRTKKSQRKRYVTDGELAEAMSCTDPVLSGFLELCYLTGQRPSDVLRMRRQDVQDGALCVEQRKTGNASARSCAKLRIKPE